MFKSNSDAASKPPRTFARLSSGRTSQFQFRRPVAADGPAVTALVAQCPPLDPNSAYCNLLQCTHFADSCVIAERDGAMAGWVSGYRPPSEPECFFVWQVAVAPSARGQRLGGRMIEALLDRPSAQGVTHLITTVTDDNLPSWALFEGLAKQWSTALAKSAHFHRGTHFAGAHATEWLARIGPLSRSMGGSTQGELAT